MAYQLEDLLKGLDEPTIKQVKEVISKTSKELDAKIFIDGDGQHFVPHARFDEVVPLLGLTNNVLFNSAMQLTAQLILIKNKSRRFLNRSKITVMRRPLSKTFKNNSTSSLNLQKAL